jgi:quercetin dioxygenase-like cupin family protein/DNA-binding XRE family transcriptional regulator
MRETSKTKLKMMRPDFTAKHEAEIARIGRLLRETRMRLGLTLQQVAVSADLTKGFVSQVERGEASASLGSLYRLCESLGIPVSLLFSSKSSGKVVRQSAGRAVYVGGSRSEGRVCTPPSERRGQVVEVCFSEAGPAPEDFWTHEGELVTAFVTSGELEVRFPDRTVTLGPGDSITYSPAEPHAWWNPSANRVTTVLFFHLPAQY